VVGYELEGYLVSIIAELFPAETYARLLRFTTRVQLLRIPQQVEASLCQGALSKVQWNYCGLGIGKTRRHQVFRRRAEFGHNNPKSNSHSENPMAIENASRAMCSLLALRMNDNVLDIPERWLFESRNRSNSIRDF
jgi:hypothetical protein